MAYISPPLVANATWGIMIRKTCNNNDGDRECNVEDNKCDSVTTLMLLTMGATHIVMVILKKDMEDNSSDSDSESTMDDNDDVKTWNNNDNDSERNMEGNNSDSITTKVWIAALIMAMA